MRATKATRRTLAGAVIAAFLTVMLAPAAADAQGRSPPDLTGSWERHRAPPGDPTNPPPEASPPLKSALLAEWQARRAAAQAADARGEPIATGYTHCLPDGVPSMMSGPFPFEILQGATQLNITQEAYNQTRRIYFGRPQVTLDDIELGFYGHSVAEWQGDTLVVDTIGIKDYIRFRDAPHSPDMRITERFRLVTPDVLWDEITIEDPEVLEKPWTVTFAYRRMPDYVLLEYVCEDNREYADENGIGRLRVTKPE